MATRKLLGHMGCPECDFPDAEVREDKNGDPYRYCTDCNAQYFTRGDAHKVKNLIAKMRAVRAAAAVDPAPAPVPGQKPPAAKPAGSGARTLLG